MMAVLGPQLDKSVCDNNNKTQNNCFSNGFQLLVLKIRQNLFLHINIPKDQEKVTADH